MPWTASSRPRSTAEGSTPRSYWSRSAASAPCASPARIRPSSAPDRRRGPTGRASSRTCSAVTAPAPWAIAWSRIERPSRAEPSAARAISASASGSTSTPFGLRDRAEMGGERFGRNAPQVEPLAARQDGDRDLVDLGRREQELDVRRRLLERLQERVERVLRQHVDFVDDIDLVARRDRGIAHRLDDLAHVVDAGVGGGVHLDHVDMPPFGDRAARLADAAGRRSSARRRRPGRCSSAPWRSAARSRSCRRRARR